MAHNNHNNKGSLRELLLTGGISEAEFQAIKPAIYKRNLSTFTFLGVLAAIIGFALFLSAHFIPSLVENQTAYAALTIAAVLLLIWCTFAKNGAPGAPVIPFVALVYAFAFGIYLGTANSPDMLSVTFMVLLVALPLLVIDRPYKVTIVIAVAVVGMVAAALGFKYGSTCEVDILNTICFGCLSVFANVILTRSQINEVVLHAQAERGRRTDALTGLRNANAYHEAIDKLDDQVTQGEVTEYGVIVADVNYLKLTNDSYGHATGDELIRTSGKLLCDVFAHSPVMRIGGDEFVVILRGRDYEHRHELLTKLGEEMEKRTFECENLTHNIAVAYGLGEYDPVKEMRYADVFHEADNAMYECKAAMKAARNA